MFSIILTVIAIALMAAVTAVSLNYVPLDAQMRAMIQHDAAQGIKALDCAVSRYLDGNRDSSGNIIYPGDNVNLVPAVTPGYGFLPANVRKQMTWAITTGELNSMPAVGICLKPIGASTPIQQQVLANLQAQEPVGSTFVGTGCNATANVAGGTTLTYWIPLAHIN